MQIVSAAGLMEKAQEMWEQDKVLQPVRGSILDRNNHILAEDGPSYTVIVNPKVIHELKREREIAQGLATILQKPESELMDLVTKKRENGNYFQWVEVRSEGWKIDNDLADEIMEYFKLSKPTDNRKNLYVHGIYLEESQKRYYPSNQMASHVLGYFDKNGKAVGGLESQYNKVLSGTPGRIITERDAIGYDLPDAKASYEPAVDGTSIQLTIDQQIQSYMERAMEKAFLQWKPKSMSAIAVNPKTMEILAMANYPNFNPAKYWDDKTETKAFYNHAIGSQYEPGSTFKLVTLAGAVEEWLFNPTETYQSGSIAVPGREPVRDHNQVGWGKITYLEGLKRSSNVAFVKLGFEKLGNEKLKNYINLFGFGEKTGIDLPGEAKGLIKFQYQPDYATATYGQGGVSVTAIQQAAAYAAIANGGKLMKPYIVKSLVDTKTGEVLQKNEPQFVRQVVTPATAQKVSELLEQVVSDQEIGTGRNAFIDGYRVAGKTGTANIVINGKYSVDTWLISFIGYAPVEDPQILVAVIADEPDLKGDYHLGGQVAAPVFKEIVSQSLRYMGVSAKAKTDNSVAKDLKLNVPDLINQSLVDAKKTLSAQKFAYDTVGKGTKIIAQYPMPGTQITASQRIYMMTEPVEDAELPDLKGKSLRDALELCVYMKVECQATGEGYVVNQKISDEGDKKTAVLELKPWLEGGVATGLSTGSGSGSGSGSTNKSSGSVQTSGAKATPTPTPKSTPKNTSKPTPTPTPDKKP
ncbi:penicillin-binding transpeptidase domain-containing protein [Paenibacillus koleovorans]|uniref:penicillin-binding transpeptidase domain-containing protein n=1 Tax=Paenibacillus koleovorans TaxID=121608 RepID=UPI001FE90E95|nr:penicillin-binding transpeptidase domain-containing protein [Paenibacillus koleovorans]